MKVRISASVLAIGLAFGLTGCGMVTPVATNISYDASDGVSATQGDVALRNIMVITSDSANETGSAVLVLTAINSGTEDRTVQLQFEVAGSKKNVTIDVAAGQTLALGVGDAEPIELTGFDAAAGSVVEVYVQSGSNEGQLVNVPVLDNSLAEYQHLG